MKRDFDIQIQVTGKEEFEIKAQANHMDAHDFVEGILEKNIGGKTAKIDLPPGKHSIMVYRGDEVAWGDIHIHEDSEIEFDLESIGDIIEVLKSQKTPKESSRLVF